MRAALFGVVGGGRGLHRGVEPASGRSALIVAMDGPVEARGGGIHQDRSTASPRNGAGWWVRWLGTAVVAAPYSMVAVAVFTC